MSGRSTHDDVPRVPGRLSLAARLFDWATRTSKAERPEVHEALLLTLPDSPLLLWLSMLWSQLPAWVAWLISGSDWAAAWVLGDMALNGARWWLNRRHSRDVAAHRRPPRVAMVGVEIAWFLCMACGVCASLAIPDLRSTLLAGCVSFGFPGYLAAKHCGFPRLAGFLIGLLPAALTIGLLRSPFPGLAQIGLLVPSAGAAYIVLLMHNHRILVGAVRAQVENRRLSRHDPLTGLPNRLLLHERLTDLCLQLQGRGRSARFAVLCLDLDGFKAVNDRHGHLAGDRLLECTAERLRATVRDLDLVCRIGGDEFIVVLPGADHDETVEIARRLIEAAQTPHEVSAAEVVRAGMSIGIAIAPDHGTEPEPLISRADEALYQVKRSGKGAWRVHS